MDSDMRCIFVKGYLNLIFAVSTRIEFKLQWNLIVEFFVKYFYEAKCIIFSHVEIENEFSFEKKNFQPKVIL